MFSFSGIHRMSSTDDEYQSFWNYEKTKEPLEEFKYQIVSAYLQIYHPKYRHLLDVSSSLKGYLRTFGMLETSISMVINFLLEDEVQLSPHTVITLTVHYVDEKGKPFATYYRNEVEQFNFKFSPLTNLGPLHHAELVSFSCAGIDITKDIQPFAGPTGTFYCQNMHHSRPKTTFAELIQAAGIQCSPRDEIVITVKENEKTCTVSGIAGETLREWYQTYHRFQFLTK